MAITEDHCPQGKIIFDPDATNTDHFNGVVLNSEGRVTHFVMPPCPLPPGHKALNGSRPPQPILTSEGGVRFALEPSVGLISDEAPTLPQFLEKWFSLKPVTRFSEQEIADMVTEARRGVAERIQKESLVASRRAQLGEVGMDQLTRQLREMTERASVEAALATKQVHLQALERTREALVVDMFNELPRPLFDHLIAAEKKLRDQSSQQPTDQHAR